MYFNEIDPFACEWLANLFPGHWVDSRGIRDVQPEDLSGHRRLHFFAGIAGWELALQLAGWPDDWEVWTGSCPCQPFSSAGKRKGTADERHLWPEFFRLINAVRPPCIFGEQVASKDALGWLDGIFADLEGAGYACAAADLCAASVNAPHIRQRLYWVAVADSARWEAPMRRQGQHERNELEPGCGGMVDGLEHAESNGRNERRTESERGSIAGGCGVSGLAVAGSTRPQERAGDTGIQRGAGCAPEGEAAELRGSEFGGLVQSDGAGPQPGRVASEAARYGDSFEPTSYWSDYDIIPCRDGKARRVGRGVQPLAHGISRSLGRGQPELARLVRRARANRVGRLRAYGNAIVPQVAAVFVRAVLEAIQ